MLLFVTEFNYLVPSLFKFKHNNLKDLEEKIIKHNQNSNSVVYVVTESVFSMDGDSPDLLAISENNKKT